MMKKVATAAIFAALVTTSIAPAFATSRPKALVVNTDSVATVLPTTLAASTAVVGNPDAFDSYVASKPYVTDPKLYGGLLEYFKADLSFEGALYQALQAKGIDSTALSAAYGKLDQSIANLIAYLQTTVSMG